MKKTGKYILLVLLALLVVAPLIIALLVSFIPNDQFLAGVYLPKSLNFANYVDAFQKAHIMSFTVNTLIISFIMVASQLLLASMAAYAFVFVEFRGRQLLFGLFLATMMIPFESTFISNFQTIKSIGLMDSYVGMALPFVASAFAIFFLRQTFRQIPHELYEASQISGLTHFKFYARVVMPMAKKSLVTLGIYLFLSAWNMYLWPLIISTNNSVRTVQIGLRQLQSQETLAQWGTIMAAAILIIIPTLVLLYLTQNRLQEGLAEGAVK